MIMRKIAIFLLIFLLVFLAVLLGLDFTPPEKSTFLAFATLLLGR